MKNFYHKIDQYLLSHYPSLWVTRVHLFLPGVVIIIGVIVGVNLLLGWNPQNDLPESGYAFLLLIIPVLVYLVYWFIFQARYNVLKSGGKVSLGKEYMVFFAYFSLFFATYLTFFSIPFSNDLKMKLAINKQTTFEDAFALNQGNVLVNEEGIVQLLKNGKYRVKNNNLSSTYWIEDSKANDPNSFFIDEEVDEVITQEEAYRRIENYINSFNHYTYNSITASPQEILKNRVENFYSDDYNRKSYGVSVSTVRRKINKLLRLHFDPFVWDLDAYTFWIISIGIMFWFSAVIWMFKQMKRRQFIISLVMICLTPFVIGILGVILFEFIIPRSFDLEPELALGLLILTQLIFLIISISSFSRKKLNKTAYVFTMYSHFWLPLLPMWIFAYLYEVSSKTYYNEGYSYYSHYTTFGLSRQEYWLMAISVSAVLVLLSIALFKPFYRKYYALPQNT